MAIDTTLSITSIAGLTNNPNQTITGTGVVGATVKVLDGTTVLGTAVVGSDGTWSEVVALSGQGGHLVTAQSVSPLLTTLVDFDGANGSNPSGGLVRDSEENLYGITAFGGSSNVGTIFELSGVDHKTLTTLVSFDWTNGASPIGNGLINDENGNLLGNTLLGGQYGLGTIFELSGSNHKTLTTLVNFDGLIVGNPMGSLIFDSLGDLYGTSVYGGSNGLGTIFKLNGLNHKTLTTLVSFDGLNGGSPMCGLVFDDFGNLYGTSVYGGSNGIGTIFELSGRDYQTLTTLVNFDGLNGSSPNGGLTVDEVGNLYGTTTSGGFGSNGGTIFELSGADHKTLTTLVTFDGLNGSAPIGNLVFDGVGSFYGTTIHGGTNDLGTVFELSGVDYKTITTLVNFDGTNGNGPHFGSLTFDDDGNLFGTTISGGANNLGTIFKLNLSSDQVTVSVDYIIDTLAPSIAHLSEVSTNVRNTLAKVGDIITESFTSTDSVTNVLINGQVASVVHGLGDNYTATYTVQVDSINGLSSAVITAQDLAGNVTISHAQGSVTIDTIAPVISYLAETTSNQSPTIAKPGEIITETFSAVDALIATVNIDNINALVTQTAENNYIAEMTMRTGRYGVPDIVITAIDAAGNVSTLATQGQVTMTPDFRINSAGGLTYNPDQMISGVAAARSLVSVYDNGLLLGETRTNSDGSWNFRTTLAQSGDHAISAIDTASFPWPSRSFAPVDSNVVSYTLDPLPPAVTISTLSSNIQEPNQLISGTGLAGSSIQIFDGSALVSSTTVGDDGTWSQLVSLSGTATHNITATNSANYQGGAIQLNPLNTEGPDNHTINSVTSWVEGLNENILLTSREYWSGTQVSYISAISGSDQQTHVLIPLPVDSSPYYWGKPITIFSDLVATTSGKVYGISTLDTRSAIFELTGPDYQTYSTVVNFDSNLSELVAGANGSLFAVAASGDSHSIVRFSGANLQTQTTLNNHSLANKSISNLSTDSEGDLFGISSSGVNSAGDVIFEFSGAGHQTFTSLLDNTAENHSISSNVVIDSKQNIYFAKNSSSDGLSQIYELNANTHQVSSIAKQYGFVSDISIDAKDNLFFSNGNAIYKLSGSNHETADALILARELTDATTTGGQTSAVPVLMQWSNQQGVSIFSDVIVEPSGDVLGIMNTFSKTWNGSFGHPFELTGFNDRTLVGTSNTIQLSFANNSTNQLSVAAPLTITTNSSHSAFWSGSLLEGVTDAIQGVTLSINSLTYSVNGGGASTIAPRGIQLVNNQLLVDPSNSAFGHLTTGQSETIVASYLIADDHGGSVAQTNTIVIGGPAIDPMILNNHAPTVVAPLATTFSKGSQAFWSNLLSGATDVDAKNTLNVTDLRFSVAGAARTAAAPTGIQFANNQLLVDPNSTAFKDLTVGQTETIVATYNISDGYGGAVAQTNSLAVTGLGATSAGSNPTSSPSLISVAAALQSTSTAGTQGFWSNLLAGAIDSNPNAHLDVANLRFTVNSGASTAITPVGLQYANKSIMVDPNNTNFRALAAGQSDTIVAHYDIVDGSGSSVAQTDTIIINGQGNQGDSSVGVNIPTPNNHAPQISAPVVAQAGVKASAFWSNMLSGASDSDVGNQLHVSNVSFSLNGGVAVSTAPAGIQVANDQLLVDPSSTAFNHLGVGQSDTIVTSYNVVDGHGGSAAQTDTVTISGPTATVANGIITGTVNHDILTGTVGNDTFLVGAGADTLTGGKGADVFKYTSLSNSPTSASAPTTTITDFSTADGDRVDVTAILTGTSTLNSTIHINQAGASNTSLSITVGGVEYYIANVPNQTVSVPEAVANVASGVPLATALHGADWTTVVDVASAHGAPSSVTATGAATVTNATANPAGDWTTVVQAGAATMDTTHSQVTFATPPTANAVSIQTVDTTVHEVSNVTAVAWHS